MNEIPIHPENAIERYPKDLLAIITRPSDFFRRLSITGSLGAALAFGLITHWWAHGIEFLVGQSLSLGLLQSLPIPNISIIQWFWGTGAVLIDPILTLISLFVSSFILWISALIWFKPVSFETVLRINAFALASSVFGIIPGLGSLVSHVMGFIYLVIGFREVFGMSSARSIWIAIFPKVLFLFSFFFLFIFMGAVLWKFLGLAV